MSQKESTQKKWSKIELIIAYYIAKWDYNGLSITEDELVNCILDTSKASLKFQVMRFRSLLGLGEEWMESEGCKANKEVVDELANITVVRVRKMVADYIEENACQELKNKTETKSINKEVNKRRDALNEQSKVNFENKLAHLKKYRRLRKK